MYTIVFTYIQLGKRKREIQKLCKEMNCWEMLESIVRPLFLQLVRTIELSNYIDGILFFSSKTTTTKSYFSTIFFHIFTHIAKMKRSVRTLFLFKEKNHFSYLLDFYCSDHCDAADVSITISAYFRSINHKCWIAQNCMIRVRFNVVHMTMDICKWRVIEAFVAYASDANSCVVHFFLFFWQNLSSFLKQVDQFWCSQGFNQLVAKLPNFETTFQAQYLNLKQNTRKWLRYYLSAHDFV